MGEIDFPSDYTEARRRFCAAANARDFQLESHAIDATGPEGQQLFIDVAIGGRAEAQQALVLSSGLHGVEAPFGSAVQLAVLESEALCSAEDTQPRMVLIHALNPFGFAWHRRTNEDNVDLNRNFLREGQEFSGAHEIYRQLNGLLNPARPPTAWDCFPVRLAWSALRVDRRSLRQAIAAGQYEFPKGIFFGGHRPSQTQAIVREHLPRWLDGASQAIHLDFHTGLGRWGTYQLLLDCSLDVPQLEQLQRHFGATTVRRYDAEDQAYCTRGSLGAWCTEQVPQCDYRYMCVEFGTYPIRRVLAGLRAENQAYHWGGQDRPSVVARKNLRELLCPRSNRWRRTVIERAIQVCSQAADALRTN